MKTERTQIHFLYNVFAAVASSDLKVPISCRQEWGSVLGEGGGLQTGAGGSSLHGDWGQSFQYTASRAKNLANPTS